VGPGRALELLLAVQRVGASEVLPLGLVERIAPAGQALAVARAPAGEILRWDAEAVRAVKVLLREGTEMPY
jgi:enoyl-CoA hydratase/carnithine racemase